MHCDADEKRSLCRARVRKKNVGQRCDGDFGVSKKMIRNGIPHHGNHEETGGGRAEKAGTTSRLVLK